MPITIECHTDELEILLEGAKETGDCMLILHTTDDETVCLRARHARKPGRPRKQQPAAAALTPEMERIRATMDTIVPGSVRGVTAAEI